LQNVHHQRKLHIWPKRNSILNKYDKFDPLLFCQCSFAHGEHELKQKEHLHFNYKTKPCHQFFEKGFCNYGRRCQYLHSELRYVIQFKEFLLRIYEEHHLMTQKLRNLTLNSIILEQMGEIFMRSQSLEEYFYMTQGIDRHSLFIYDLFH